MYRINICMLQFRVLKVSGPTSINTSPCNLSNIANGNQLFYSTDITQKKHTVAMSEVTAQ